MALLRSIRLLPFILLATGVAAALPLPVSQAPGQQNRPAPALEDHTAPDGYGNPFLWACLADLQRGHLAQGEQNCSRAIELDGKEASAYELRGYAYLLEHRFEQAEADFLVALKLNPDSAEDLAGYGKSLSGLGQFEAAAAQFGKAVALAPQNAAYRNGRCWAIAGTGKNLDRALADCNKALALAPGTAAPLNSRGLVELRLGRFDAAIGDYTDSLAANRHQPSALFGRALAYLALKQNASGRADIVSARKGDSEIDGLFVTLGVLPRQCPAQGRDCPPGFPPPTPGSSWMVAGGRMP